MADVSAIRIRGLDEFRRAVKRADSDAPKAMRKALNIAGQIIVDKTLPWMPHNTGAAKASLKTRSTQTAGRVTEGGPKAPYVPWLDFGGKRTRYFGKTGRTHTDPVGRKVRREGTYIYVTLAKRREEIEEKLQDVLIEVARGAGLDVQEDR